MGEEYPVVQRVFADTPAYDAGIAAGDIILSVDGKDLRILDLDGVLGRIRGVEGTKAKLVVQSGAESREVELARKVSDLQMVMTDMVNAKVGYINIVEFSGDSVNDFKKQSKTWIVRGRRRLSSIFGEIRVEISVRPWKLRICCWAKGKLPM